MLLETFVPNLVFLTRPSLQILGKTQTGVFSISGFLVNPYKKKLSQFQNSDNTAMKLGPVSKLTKINKGTLKNLTRASCRKIMPSLPFFQITTNLEQSGSRVSDPESAKLIFSLTVTVLSYRN